VGLFSRLEAGTSAPRGLVESAVWLRLMALNEC
jgi:hypothetical protein